MAHEFPPITWLIPDLKTGDEESWNRLVGLFTPGLTGKAFVLLRNSKLHHKLTPEDLVNEVFAKAWRHHQLIRGQSTFQVAKWLLTILTNSFRDHCRRGGLPEEASPSWEIPEEVSPQGSPLEDFEQEVQLHAALAELPPEDREILVLKYWRGLTHEQIADQVGGTSKASITRRLQRLLPLLHKAMTEES